MRVIFIFVYPAQIISFSSSLGRHSFEFRRVLTAARQQRPLDSDSELDFDGFVTVEFGENGLLKKKKKKKNLNIFHLSI